jgi:phosphatidylglycerophosphatase A
MLKGLEKVIASGFGTGYLPIAPGTWGSLLACILYWFFFPQNVWIYLGILLILFFLGVGIGTRVEKEWGHDSRKIVIDEIFGLFVTMFLFPKTLILLLAGFFLFRLCDIKMPFPIAQSERIPGGWGVMVDDFIAGIYANIGLHLILFLAPKFAKIF